MLGTWMVLTYDKHHRETIINSVWKNLIRNNKALTEKTVRLFLIGIIEKKIYHLYFDIPLVNMIQ